MSLAQVVKVRAQALDQARMQLNAAKARAAVNERALASVREQLSALKGTQISSPQDIALYAQHAAWLRDELAAAAEKLELSRKEIIHYEHLYKRANIEHEKIAALHAEELAAAAKERQRKEALELDEIAVMLMSRKQND